MLPGPELYATAPLVETSRTELLRLLRGESLVTPTAV